MQLPVFFQQVMAIAVFSLFSVMNSQMRLILTSMSMPRTQQVNKVIRAIGTTHIVIDAATFTLNTKQYILLTNVRAQVQYTILFSYF
jgi:hypothetical protein